MANKFWLKSWACDNVSCEYTQNFPQTQANINQHFPGWGLVPDQCPSCKIGIINELSGPDLRTFTQSSVITDAEIDAKIKWDHAQQKEVPLTDDEKQEKVNLRDQSMAVVDSVAYEAV